MVEVVKELSAPKMASGAESSLAATTRLCLVSRSRKEAKASEATSKLAASTAERRRSKSGGEGCCCCCWEVGSAAAASELEELKLELASSSPATRSSRAASLRIAPQLRAIAGFEYPLEQRF